MGEEMETWVEKKNEDKTEQKMSERYSWYFLAAYREKRVKKGRAKGGQVVGIRKGVKEFKGEIRRSQDEIENAEGRKLLGICEELGLKVLNWRAKGDREGRITFVRGGEECNGSIIDYLI
ncbi:hypothetical protein M0804_013342 [Polistes exclamans]|nr:hypothetical protein M0804_013342 [Polistes exclamans]